VVDVCDIGLLDESKKLFVEGELFDDFSNFFIT